MTDLSTRPRRPAAPVGRAPADEVPTRPLAVSTLLVAVALLVAGLVAATGLAVVGWLAAHDGSVEGAMRVGVTGWLAGHGAAPQVEGVPLRLVPLGVPLLLGLLAVRGGRWAVTSSAPADGREALPAVLAAAVPYGLALSGLATVALPDDVLVDPARAGALGALLVAAGVAVGLAPGVGWSDRLRELLPEPARSALRGAVAGLVAILAAATVVTLSLVAMHAGDVWGMGQRLSPDPVGAALLVLLAALTLPNAVLWCASYLLGPGFAVGTATSVSPSGVVLGPLPAYPPFAALPDPGDAPGWATGVLLLPVLAGVVAGVVADRRAAAGPWWRTAVTGAAAGALSGAALGGLLLVSGGAVGPGRMEMTGPASAAAAVAVVSLGLGAAIGGVGARVVRERTGLETVRAWGARAVAGLRDRVPDRLRRGR